VPGDETANSTGNHSVPHHGAHKPENSTGEQDLQRVEAALV